MDKNYNIFNDNIFAFDKQNNIIGDLFLGISGTIASIMTPESDLGRLYNLQACPVSNTGFDFRLTFGGETVCADEWQWLPNAMLRRGQTDGLKIIVFAPSSIYLEMSILASF